MDRVSATGALTAAIAHEINQPLAAVLSNAQAALRFLSQERPDLDEVRDTLRDIVGDDKRAAEVIRRLRALLKKEGTSPELIDLNVVAAEVIALVHSEAVMRNVSLTTDLAEDTPRVLGDRIQIQQVILNLLINAMDAVRAQPPGDRRVTVASRPQGSEFAEIRVTDSGPGIDANEIARIFDPFHTTKSGGMGMGLAICRAIVGKHGGRLRVENAAGGGAQFSFTLPVQ
jgi:signal transduction histidine kinase